MTPFVFAKKSICKRCKVPFFFDGAIRFKSFCPACLKLNIAEQTKAKHARRKATDARFGYCGDTLTSGAVLGYHDIGRRLGISHQAVREAERSALAKLRKAFKFEMLTKQFDNSLR